VKATFVVMSSLSTPLVRFYSIKLGERPVSEFYDFQQRMSLDEDNKQEVGEINSYIKEIATKYGAQEWCFRSEDSAEALPPRTQRFIEINAQNDYGIRLYCIRLGPGIVILLNGNRKTTQKVNDCPLCNPHFQIARKLSTKINHAITGKEIALDHAENEITIEDDFELFI